ncbi:hypothetical protein [Saccharopolyspora sp. NPDC049357]|uniref:hypothetical protein n=1 Tax=Saccharopolyspora sp. NPDC049357 TaxID=3154507 RepID=UPI003416B8DA
MSEQEHPLEALHRARDEVAAAASRQARTPHPSLQELHAFGSAIVGTLAQLGHLSTVLANQVGHFDEHELQRAKISDDPADKLRVAGTHLVRLSDQLATAVTDAHRYWAAMESVDLHTSGDPRPQHDPNQ